MGIVRFDVQPYTFCTHARLMLDNMHDTPISLTHTHARTHTHAHTHTHTHTQSTYHMFLLPLFLRVSPANTGRAVMSPLTIYLRFVTTRSILLHWEWKMAIVFISHFVAYSSWTHQYVYNQCNTSHRPPVYQELTLAVYHICTTWLARYTNTAVLSQWTCAAQMSNSACVVVLTVEVGFVCFSLKRGEVAFWYVSDYVACL